MREPDDVEVLLDERMLLIEFLKEKKLLWDFIDWRHEKTPAEIAALTAEGDHFD